MISRGANVIAQAELGEDADGAAQAPINNGSALTQVQSRCFMQWTLTLPYVAAQGVSTKLCARAMNA